MVGKIRVFFVVIILCGCASNPRQEGKLKKHMPVREFLSLLPSAERFVLEHFFRCLIQEDAVGYVLLGGKPMSFYSYLQPKIMTYSPRSEPLDCLDRFFEGFDEKDALFHKGWEIWKKYEHAFCGENVFFDVFEQDKELRSMKVIVINKRLMLPLLDQYFYKFTSLDPSLKDKESLFEALLHNQKVKEGFYSRPDLMGICLGYGEKNAELFQKMLTLFTSLGWLDFTLKTPSPDQLENLEKEWSDLKESFKTGLKDHVSRKFRFHFGVGFRADYSNPETPILQKKYTEYYKKVTQAYDSADFLEKTLELISLANSTSS